MATRTIPIHQVDAFAAELFQGNPAAVCPLDAWLPDTVLQAVAAENNLSETAFTVPVGTGAFHIRWFTPTVEVDLCGHATLAAAHVLLGDADRIAFRSASGHLSVAREGELLFLDFPALPVDGPADDPAIGVALGQPPIALYRIREVHFARYLLAEYATQAEVAELAVPDVDDTNVIATAPGDAVDFVSRFFAPGSGIPEDPVTGSAHCTLTPFWAERLGRSRLRARQISSRGGDLVCELVGDRVRIGGTAVTYLVGEIRVPG